MYFYKYKTFCPLSPGYDAMGFEMSKPHLRAELEADLKRWEEDTIEVQLPNTVTFLYNYSTYSFYHKEIWMYI